ncbi:MAG TPA: hypothetical protein VN806_12990 [Caulobacteraceae bacterium]|nr:hypothetical protein [Caulobacteraceae bacterium]
MTTSRNNGPKTPRGKPFAPGNPGRPKGSRHKTTLAIEALLEGQAEALTQRAIDAALGGDGAALRLCLERIAPVRRGRPVTFKLPAVKNTADVLTALGAVIAAVAGGHLTPDEAESIAGLLDTKRRTIEQVEIEDRLAKLEARAETKP